MQKSALLIIDVQNDFCPGGALPVPDGHKVIPIINRISPRFFKVIATQDWHPSNHVSFAKTHNKKPGETVVLESIEQVLWPDHCIPGSFGAEFHKDLDLRPVDLILRKGNDPRLDSYSAFYENDRKTETGLHYYLLGLGIRDVYVCGLAADFCVYFTAVDALSLGFTASVISDAAKGLDQPKGSLERAFDDMKKRGIPILSHESLPRNE